MKFKEEGNGTRLVGARADNQITSVPLRNSTRSANLCISKRTTVISSHVPAGNTKRSNEKSNPMVPTQGTLRIINGVIISANARQFITFQQFNSSVCARRQIISSHESKIDITQRILVISQESERIGRKHLK